MRKEINFTTKEGTIYKGYLTKIDDRIFYNCLLSGITININLLPLKVRNILLTF